MITRVQMLYISEDTVQHLKKHGSKYLGAGALGAAGMAAHALSGEAGEEVKGHAEDAKESYEKFKHTMKGMKAVADTPGIDSEVKQQQLKTLGKQAMSHHEDKQESIKKMAAHPAIKKAAAGIVGAGALGAAAQAKREQEKKQQN